MARRRDQNAEFRGDPIVGPAMQKALNRVTTILDQVPDCPEKRSLQRRMQEFYYGDSNESVADFFNAANKLVSRHGQPPGNPRTR